MGGRIKQAKKLIWKETNPVLIGYSPGTHPILILYLSCTHAILIIIQKYRRFENCWPSRKAQAFVLISNRKDLYNFKINECKLWEEMQFTVAIYYTINSQNFKYLKDNSIVKKNHKPGWCYHIWYLYGIWKLRNKTVQRTKFVFLKSVTDGRFDRQKMDTEWWETLHSQLDIYIYIYKDI